MKKRPDVEIAKKRAEKGRDSDNTTLQRGGRWIEKRGMAVERNVGKCSDSQIKKETENKSLQKDKNRNSRDVEGVDLTAETSDFKELR